jgi:hypothetical protein
MSVLCTVLLVDGILSKRLLMFNGIRMRRFRDFLSDTLLVLGVATVLLSIFQPFLILGDVKWVGVRGMVLFHQADFFTFKVTYVSDVYPRSEFWGFYWFNSENWFDVVARSSVGYFLMVTFAAQILTLVLGLFTLSLKPRRRIVPLVLCLVMTLLLTWALHLEIMEYSMYPFVYSWNLGDGYWLTFTSVLCLLSSVILARGRKSRIMFEG